MNLAALHQDALNEIARLVFIADRANKLKADILKPLREFVETNEDALRDGVEAVFAFDGKTMRCRLVLSPSPKWSVKELVVSE